MAGQDQRPPPPEAFAVDVGVTGSSGQAPVAEQLLQFPDITAAFVEQQIGRAMPQAVGAHNSNSGGMTRGGKTAVEGLVADRAAIPARKHQFASGKFHGTPAQTHSFEPFEKDGPLAEGIRQPRHERDITVFATLHLEPGGGEIPCPVPDQPVRGKQRSFMEPAGRKKDRFRQMRGQPPEIVRAQLPQRQEHLRQIRRFEEFDFLRIGTEPGGEAIHKRTGFIQHFIKERDARLHLEVVGGGAVARQVLVVTAGRFPREGAEIETGSRGPSHQLEPRPAVSRQSRGRELPVAGGDGQALQDCGVHRVK
jgi:hypothetical protein